eukprot:4427332-Ditylum_brightwellii.AAC.1
MAHHASEESTRHAGASHAGFETGPQGDNKGWSIVNNNGQGSKKKTEKQAKTTIITGGKRKIFVDTMEEDDHEEPVEVVNATIKEQIKATGERDIGERT